MAGLRPLNSGPLAWLFPQYDPNAGSTICTKKGYTISCRTEDSNDKTALKESIDRLLESTNARISCIGAHCQDHTMTCTIGKIKLPLASLDDEYPFNKKKLCAEDLLTHLQAAENKAGHCLIL
jgi:hypothetical protein